MCLVSGATLKPSKVRTTACSDFINQENRDNTKNKKKNTSGRTTVTPFTLISSSHQTKAKI